MGRYVALVFLQFDLRDINSLSKKGNITNIKRAFFEPIKEKMKDKDGKIQIKIEHIWPLLGKHDVLLVLSSNDLLKLTTAVYLGANNCNSLWKITDMSRIINYAPHNQVKSLEPALGLILIRYDILDTSVPSEIVRNEEKIINEIKSIANIKELNLNVDIFHTYSCHEICLIVHGNSYTKMWQYIYELKRRCNVQKTLTIPILDAHNKRFNTIKDKVEAIILFERTDSHDTKIILKCKDELSNIKDLKAPEISHRFGGFDYRIGPVKVTPSQLKDILSHLINPSNITLDISNTTCLLSLPNIKPLNHFDKKLWQRNDQIKLPIKFVNYQGREGKYLSNKVWAESVYSEMLYNNPSYALLLPPYLYDILKELENISNRENISGEALRILRLCKHQRLAGTQTGESAGLATGALESLGGYQRLIFSAEAIPQDLMNKKRWRKKLFFSNEWKGTITFEGTGEYASLFPKTQMLCVPVSKYNPQLWPTILGHEIGHIFATVNKESREVVEAALEINNDLIDEPPKGLKVAKMYGEFRKGEIEYFIREHLADYFSYAIFGRYSFDTFYTYVSRRVKNQKINDPGVNEDVFALLARIGVFGDWKNEWAWGELVRLHPIKDPQNPNYKRNKLVQNKYKWLRKIISDLRETEEWKLYENLINDNLKNNKSDERIEESLNALESNSVEKLCKALDNGADMIDFSRALLILDHDKKVTPNVIANYLQVGSARRVAEINSILNK